jgi:hypothetical protein
MGRVKGIKNKKVADKIRPKKVVEEAVLDDEIAPLIPGPEACQCESKNPLVGYTIDEVRAFVAEINPSCGRGGCVHLKEFHVKNTKGQLECHLCNCAEFLNK